MNYSTFPQIFILSPSPHIRLGAPTLSLLQRFGLVWQKHPAALTGADREAAALIVLVQSPGEEFLFERRLAGFNQQRIIRICPATLDYPQYSPAGQVVKEADQRKLRNAVSRGLRHFTAPHLPAQPSLSTDFDLPLFQRMS